jgi:hypothetical protein
MRERERKSEVGRKTARHPVRPREKGLPWQRDILWGRLLRLMGTGNESDNTVTGGSLMKSTVNQLWWQSSN